MFVIRREIFVKFDCPHCEQTIEIQDSDIDQYRGQQIQCPTCEGAIMMDLPEPELVEEVAPEPQPKPKPKKPKTVFKNASTSQSDTEVEAGSENTHEASAEKRTPTYRKRVVRRQPISKPSAASTQQEVAQPAPTPVKRSSLPLIIGAIVLVLTGLGGGIWVATKGNKPTRTTAYSSSVSDASRPAAKKTPTPVRTETQEATSTPETPADINTKAVQLSKQGKDKEAFGLFQQAAKQGDLDAAGNVGVCYFKAAGTRQDHDMAVQWLTKAKAADTLSAISDKLSSAGQRSQSFKYLQAAANLGDRIAQHNVGAAYIDGVGVSKDVGQGLSWYKKAADNGFALSQLKLGMAYYRGAGGLQKNTSTATMWLKKAAAQGNKDAIDGLDYLVLEDLLDRGMRKSPPDKDAAIALLIREADSKVQKMLDQGQIEKADRAGVAFDFLPNGNKADANASVYYDFQFYTKGGLLRRNRGHLFWYHHRANKTWVHNDTDIDGVPKQYPMP